MFIHFIDEETKIIGLEQVLKLIKLEFNPNIQMFDGNTPLHLAAANGHVE